MKPILFNAENVIAILEDRKGETRRIMKPQPTERMPESHNICRQPGAWDGKQFRDLWYMDTIEQNPFQQKRWFESFAPYDKGEILYVRETWQRCHEMDGNDQIVEGIEKYVYAATPEDVPHFTHWVRADGTYADFMPWRPSIHMPKEAARIFLRVNDVHIERLQDITEEQAIKEGMHDPFDEKRDFYENAVSAFSDLWDRTIKKQDLNSCGWDANPWVWVAEFERVNTI